MACYYCKYDEHGFCISPTSKGSSVKDEPFSCCCSDAVAAEIITGETRGPGRPPLKGEDMQDVLSAGRHRASRALPNIVNTPCHWRNLLFAGGGVVPIVGCRNGIISEDNYGRHHGPNKSVLDNTVGVNLHGLCVTCHNRWHTLNDPFYGERPPNGEPFVPLDHEMKAHDPVTQATEMHHLMNDLWWATPIESREDYGSIRELEGSPDA